MTKFQIISKSFTKAVKHLQNVTAPEGGPIPIQRSNIAKMKHNTQTIRIAIMTYPL